VVVLAALVVVMAQQELRLALLALQQLVLQVAGMVLDTLMRVEMVALEAVVILLLVHLLEAQELLDKVLLVGLLVLAVAGLILVIHILQVAVAVLALSVLLDLLEIQGAVVQD
jgi:hypothetical protein